MIKIFEAIGVGAEFGWMCSGAAAAAAQQDGSLELQTFNYLIAFTSTVESYFRALFSAAL